MESKWTTATILILLCSLGSIPGEPPDDHGPPDPPETKEEFVASDVGGGGWLHSGTFHPFDSDIILVGGDKTGGIWRTDDFGEAWYPWNEGLQNYDHMWSNYVEDLLGVVEPDGTVAFYAATHGGIYRATEDGPWNWMGDDQPRNENNEVPPAISLIYWRFNDEQFSDTRYYREPISFSCLGWNGENLLAAGAGRVRWNSSYETDNYPGISQEDLNPECDNDSDGPDPNYPCNPEIHPVWIHDLDHPANGWQPLDISGLDVEEFGTPRDISLTKIDGNNYLAVATHKGIFLYDFAAGEWRDLTDNIFYHPDYAPVPRTITYGSEMTAWSIHLTKRGTLYVAMQRGASSFLLEEPFPSGAYRHCITHLTTEMPWVWVGDGNAIDPYEEYFSFWDIGLGEYTYGQPDLIYLTVIDGEGEEPDTLYLGDRRMLYGLFKGEQPLEPVENQGFVSGHWSASLVGWNWLTWYPDNDCKGWIDFWGPQVIFHPIVKRDISGDKLAVQFNGRMHVSSDGGSTWDQRYCEEDVDNEGVWSSRGYNEHCVVGATFLADGKPVFSAGDTGTFVATDIEGTTFAFIHPQEGWQPEAEEDAIHDHESDHVHMLLEWKGDIEKEKRDALFINYSDRIGETWHGKLFMHLFERQAGPSNNKEEWFNITKTVSDNEELGDLNRYLFGDFAFIDDKICLLSYIHYTGQVGTFLDEDSDGKNDIVRDRYGVLKGMFRNWQVLDGKMQPVWSWVDWSEGLPVADGETTFVTQLLKNRYRDDRIFLAAARNKDVGGGLYMLEPADSSTWQVIISAEVDDEIFSQFRDFRSLAQSANGSWLYAGTRGFSTGIGGLLLCKDPSNASDMTQWEILANDPDNTIRPFEFHDELKLPFWSDDFFWGDPDKIDKRVTYVRSLAVDPRDKEVVYVGLGDVGMSLRAGLWRYDGKEWEHLSPGQPFEGIGILTLKANPYIPGQLLIGTNGQGLYIREEVEE